MEGEVFPLAIPLDIRERLELSAETGCWLWHGPIGRGGYGQLTHRDEDGRRPVVHRVVYQSLRGPIPEGLQLDHLCCVPRCANPEHLEPVTPQVNTLRRRSTRNQYTGQESCVHGHVFTESNTFVYTRPNGRTIRVCRQCDSERHRKAKAQS